MGHEIQVPSTCIYTVGGGYSQNPRADQLDWAKTTLPINQSSLAHKHAMDENPRWESPSGFRPRLARLGLTTGFISEQLSV